MSANVESWEDQMLKLPIARRVSGEHDEHTEEDPEFVQRTTLPNCGCDRCKIIRIKRRRAFKFPRSKCKSCGNLFVSLFSDQLCDECNKS